MNRDDQAQIAVLLSTVGALYGREVTPDVARLYCSSLEGHDIHAIRKAFSDHVKDTEAGRFMPKPADILAKLQASDGRPSAEEAWALVPLDERRATVWTDEIAEAAGCVQALIARGDVAGARMAFREAYARSCATARRAGKPVRWWLSRGHDRHDDDRALLEAVHLGRISHDRALQFNPTLGLPPPSAQALAIASGVTRRLQ